MANKDIKIVKVSMKIGKTTVEVSPEELEALRDELDRLFPRRAQWWYPAYPCGRWQYVTPAYSPAYIYQVTAEDGTEYSYTTSGGSKEWKTQSQLTVVSSTG